MYTFQYQLNDGDYFEYNLYHNYTLPKFRKRLVMQRFLIPVLYMVLAFFLGMQADDPVIMYAVFGIASVIWILIYRKLIEWNIRKSIKMMKQSGKTPYDKAITLVFGEDKITETTKDTENSVGYAALEKMVQGENALYLYVNAIGAQILPYRAFASDEEKEAFLQFIKGKTNAELIPGRVR